MSSEALKHLNNTDVLEYPIALSQVDFQKHITVLGYSTTRVTLAEASKVELHQNGVVRVVSKDGFAETLVSPAMWVNAIVAGRESTDTDTSLAVAHAPGIAAPQHYDNNRDLVDAPINVPRRGPGRPRRTV